MLIVHVFVHVKPETVDPFISATLENARNSIREPGVVRFDVVQQASRPNHFTVVEIWKDATAVEAHSMTAATRAFRDALAPMTGALYDERMYAGLD